MIDLVIPYLSLYFVRPAAPGVAASKAWELVEGYEREKFGFAWFDKAIWPAFSTEQSRSVTTNGCCEFASSSLLPEILGSSALYTNNQQQNNNGQQYDAGVWMH